MANSQGPRTAFSDSIQSVPDFVQKLTADSITPGRMSVLNEQYGPMSSAACGVSDGFSVASSGNTMLLPLNVVPTPVLDAPTLKPETSIATQEDIKPKIKTGKSKRINDGRTSSSHSLYFGDT